MPGSLTVSARTMVLAAFAIVAAGVNSVTANTTVNLLTNPSFEEKLVRSEWKGGGLSQYSDDKVHGQYSVLCYKRKSGNNGPIQTLAGLKQGGRYAFQGYVKLLDEKPDKMWQMVKAVLQFKDENAKNQNKGETSCIGLKGEEPEACKQTNHQKRKQLKRERERERRIKERKRRRELRKQRKKKEKRDRKKGKKDKKREKKNKKKGKKKRTKGKRKKERGNDNDKVRDTQLNVMISGTTVHKDYTSNITNVKERMSRQASHVDTETSTASKPGGERIAEEHNREAVDLSYAVSVVSIIYVLYACAASLTASQSSMATAGRKTA